MRLEIISWKKLILLSLAYLLGLTYSASILAQSARFPEELRPDKTETITIFKTPVVINTYEPKNKPKSPITFVVLHHDEQTGLKAVKSVLTRRGGKLIEVVSIFPNTTTNSRNVYFNYKGKSFCFDPNRIFSEDGIKNTLFDVSKRACKESEIPGDDDQTAIKLAVKTFSEDLLKVIMPTTRCWSSPTDPKICPGELVVAVHNSKDSQNDRTGGSISALSFVVPGGLETGDTEAAYIVNAEDSDNFFIASNPSIFSKLVNWNPKENHFTVSLQKKIPVSKEGYLSVYCGLGNMNYIAMEAEHIKGSDRQNQMINKVINVFDPKRRQ